jgi:hypothetical protein
MVFQSTSKFLPSSRWFLGSLEFLTYKFGILSLQEPELSKVAGSGTSHFPPAPVQDGLINEAQLRIGSLGKMDMDPVEDRADHTLAAQATATDPIYSPSSGSDSEYGREVYMVEQGGELPDKTTEELQREADEEIACAERLARELDKRKGHNGLHDDLGGSEDEHLDGALQGGTNLSSTHNATLTEIDSDIDQGQSVRNSVWSSTMESKFTARRPTLP